MSEKPQKVVSNTEPTNSCVGGTVTVHRDSKDKIKSSEESGVETEQAEQLYCIS